MSNGFTNHYVYIQDFNRLMFSKTKNKNKKWFCKSCLQCLNSENVLNVHKKDCLIVNGCQGVRLEKGVIKFKNFKTIFHAVLLMKLFVLMINLVKILCCTEEKMQCLNIFRVFLKNMIIVSL